MDILSQLKNQGVLTAYYDFQSGSLTSLEGNSYLGTLNGSAVLNKEGLNIPRNNGGFDTGQLFNHNEASFCFGLVSKTAAGASTEHLMGRYAPATPRYGMKTSSGNLSMFIVDSLSASFDFAPASSINFGDNVYRAIFFVYNSVTTYGYLYVNGVLVASKDMSAMAGTLDGASGNFQIGQVSSYYISGTVKNAVIIDNYAPTNTEIAQLSSQMLNSKYNSKPKSQRIGKVKKSVSNVLNSWELNPTNNIVSDTGSNQNNLTIDKQVYENDKVFNALKFNNNVLSGSKTYTANDIAYSFTINAWIKPTYFAGTSDGILKIANNPASTTTTHPAIRVYAGTIMFRYDDLPSGAVFASVTNTLNVWTMVTVTYNGSAMKIYKDGVLATSVDTAVAINTTGLTPYIGAGYSSNHFYGSIASLKILTTPLTADEILEEYNSVKDKQVTFKTDYGVNEIGSYVTGAVNTPVSNSGWVTAAGNASAKISSDVINGNDCKVLKLGAFTTCLPVSIVGDGAGYGEWEFWIYAVSGMSSGVRIYTTKADITANNPTTYDEGLEIFTTGEIKWARFNNDYYVATAAGVFAFDQWNKIKLVRTPTTITIYYNDTIPDGVSPRTNPRTGITKSWTVNQGMAFYTEAGIDKVKVCLGNKNGNYAFTKRSLS